MATYDPSGISDYGLDRLIARVTAELHVAARHGNSDASDALFEEREVLRRERKRRRLLLECMTEAMYPTPENPGPETLEEQGLA